MITTAWRHYAMKKHGGKSMTQPCNKHGTIMQKIWHWHAINGKNMALSCKKHGTTMHKSWHHHAKNMASQCKNMAGKTRYNRVKNMAPSWKKIALACAMQKTWHHHAKKHGTATKKTWHHHKKNMAPPWKKHGTTIKKHGKAKRRFGGACSHELHIEITFWLLGVGRRYLQGIITNICTFWKKYRICLFTLWAPTIQKFLRALYQILPFFLRLKLKIRQYNE